MSRRGGDRLKTACITVLWTGYLRPAPATWGSALALLLFAGIWLLGSTSIASRWAVEGMTVAGVLLSSVLSVRWGRWAVARFHSDDPRNFVLDEFAGQWLALVALPVALGAALPGVAVVMAGQFLLFRIMDVIKPPPARGLERLPAGWGILVDDLFAGLYANVVGQAVWRLTPLAAWLGVGLQIH